MSTMQKADIAVATFENGYNCAQSIFSCFSEELGVSKDLALKAATGFGGGMGRTQNVCGAVSGGILVLNLVFGRGEDESKEVQDLAYAKVREFIAAFEKVHKTTSCFELLDGTELLTSEGQARFQNENMRELCYSYVRTTVKILEKMTASKFNQK